MKRESLAAVQLALFLVCFGAHAGAVFCDDPYTAICGVDEAAKTEREARIAEIKKAYTSEALAATARAVGANPATYTEAKGYVELTLFQAELARRIDARATETEMAVVDTNVERVKSYLRAAIAEQLLEGTLTESKATELKTRVEAIQVYTQYALLKKFPNPNRFLNFGMLSFHVTCGFDGLFENAYSTLDHETPYIVLCPGWLLRAIETRGGEESFQNILQVMAHEMGHHLDWRSQPEIYGNFTACIATNFGARLKYSEKGPDHFIEELTGGKDTRFTKAWRTMNHASEITADFWGAQVLRQYLSSIRPEGRMSALHESWAGLCGSKDEGIHPDARFRVEALLASDPGIGMLMGCSGTSRAKRLGCTLAGPK